MSDSARSSVVSVVSGRFSGEEECWPFKRELLIAMHLSIGVPTWTYNTCQYSFSPCHLRRKDLQHNTSSPRPLPRTTIDTDTP